MKGTNNNIQDEFYKHLYENFEEMSGFLSWLIDSKDADCEEMRFLYEFVHYKGLDDEYHFFRENAHEVCCNDLSFPTLTL